MAYGDSKADDALANVLAAINASPPGGNAWSYVNLAHGGYTAANLAATVAADVAAYAHYAGNVQQIMVTVGANDVGALPAEAAWKADFGAFMDALHAGFPAATITVSLPWRRDYGSECDDIATWIADELVVRAAWAQTGAAIDERTVIENGDNGVTYTTDGVHWNSAGQALMGAGFYGLMYP